MSSVLTPVRPQSHAEVGTLGAERVLGQFCLPASPQERRQNEREELTDQRSGNRPERRLCWVIPDEQDAADERETDWRENPVRQLAPVHALHRVEALDADQPP